MTNNTYNPESPSNTFLNADDLCKRYKMKIGSAYALMRSADFPWCKILKFKRVRLDKLMEWEDRTGWKEKVCA